MKLKDMTDRIRAYHATTIDNAIEILKSGVFKEGCYFAFKVEDALKHAGPVVFEGIFDKDGFRNVDDKDGDWQFWLRDDIPIYEILVSSHWTDDEKWPDKGIPVATDGVEGDCLSYKVDVDVLAEIKQLENFVDFLTISVDANKQSIIGNVYNEINNYCLKRINILRSYMMISVGDEVY